ncbi:MAG: alanine dehydrogenase [Vallitaleaceae bacterium]|nr:alanine dehydrogenase [Vallitaleaceae bacterium]
MNIGCVKEIKTHEYRVGMTPDNVRAYIANGHIVYVERGLGNGSSFSDNEYHEAGAFILDTAPEVWEIAEMIIKVKEPLPEEYKYFKKNQILYTYLHLAAASELANALIDSKAKGVAYETLTDAEGSLPLLTPMSEIAGRLSVQEGAKYLEKPFGGRGVLLAGVPGVDKGKVVILGGGIVGINACKIAIGLGADVTIVDLNQKRLAYLDDIFGSRIQTMFSTEGNIKKALCEADLVIGAILIPGASAPKLIKETYLKEMKSGSVIVDVAVDQGGCCETTKVTYHDNPTYIVDDVVHYCVGNMPGAVPRTSTLALTNATLRYGLMIANKGLEQACQENEGIRNSVNIYKGHCVHKNVAESLNLPYKDISGLLYDKKAI